VRRRRTPGAPAAAGVPTRAPPQATRPWTACASSASSSRAPRRPRARRVRTAPHRNDRNVARAAAPGAGRRRPRDARAAAAPKRRTRRPRRLRRAGRRAASTRRDPQAQDTQRVTADAKGTLRDLAFKIVKEKVFLVLVIVFMLGVDGGLAYLLVQNNGKFTSKR